MASNGGWQSEAAGSDAPKFATRKSGEITVSNKVFTCLQKGHQLRENTTTGADAIACSHNCAGVAFAALAK